MVRSLLFVITSFLLTSAGFAQDSSNESAVEVGGWSFSHESEASVSIISGNANNENYIAKQKTTVERGIDRLISTASYQLAQGRETENEGFVETARKWDAGIRYEHDLSETFTPFAEHLVAGDVFSGLIQRNTYGFGGKYWFLKEKSKKVSGEFGARNVFEHRQSSENVNYNSLRAYAEAEYQLSQSTKMKFWVEHLRNLDVSEDYELNLEPSIVVSMTEVFSLKSSYQRRFDNQPASEDAKQLDSIFSTALLAQF